MNASLARIAPGSHLVTRRRGYDHHGIYLGDGRVIHYAGRWRYLRGLVEEVTLDEFCRGRDLDVAGSSAVAFDREEILRRARSRLGEHCYRVLTNNCEHFCSWCISGKSRSEQVDRWIALPRRFFGAIAHALGCDSSLRSLSTACE